MLANISLYRNTGYNIGGYHICRRGAVPSDLSGTPLRITNVKISFGDVCTADLALSYDVLSRYTYISVDTDGDRIYYGWIVDITMVSSRSDVCRVTWQWDYWRTYSKDAVLGSGRLTRSNNAAFRSRPDNVKTGFYQNPTRHDEIRDIMDNPYPDSIYGQIAYNMYRDDYWVVLQYIDKQSSSDISITEIKTILWPSGGGVANTQGSIRSSGITIEDIYQGLLEEQLGIDPDDILGAWVCPFCPYPSAFTIVGFQTYYFWAPSSSIIANVIQHKNHAYFVLSQTASISVPSSNTFTMASQYAAISQTDTMQIADFYGNIIWTRPYGVSITNTGYVGFSFSPLSGQMIVHFKRPYSGGNIPTYTDDAANGLSAIISLPALPVASNTWASYVLSGQREYEIQSAKAANQASYTKGLTNQGVGAVEGALAGSLVAPGIGTAIGAGIGLVSTLISSTINNMTEENLREKVQGLRDTAVANQAQSMLVPGQSSFWRQTNGCCIMMMETVDNGEYNADIANYGYHADMAYASCNSLIPNNQSVGPIQIEQLDVSGDIPVKARLAIRDMFSKGIYIN